MKSILALSMAAVLTLASCSREDSNDSPVKGEEKTVVMTINRGEAGTRAEGANVGNGTSIAFSSGKLYFTETSGVITKVMDVVTSGSTTATQINVMITGAQTITGVPSNTRKVYIVGNVSGLPASTGGNISAVKDLLVTMSSQYDASGAVTNVALYGQDEAMNVSGTPYTATVNVKPIAARIEIDKFTGSSVTTGALTAYKVDGIFINNYYNKIKFQGIKSGTASPADDLILNGTEANGQTPAIYLAGSTAYPTASNGTYYDFSAAGIGTAASLVYTPSSGATWSYNLLAPTASAVPHIVIRFSGFGTGDLHEGKIRYITVTGFQDASTSTTITTFEAGKIYRIKNFTFNETDLDTEPEISSVVAQVTVTLAQWDEIEVNPIH